MVFNYLIRVVAEPDLISQFAAEAVSEKQEIELLTKQAKVERHIKQLESKQERFLDLYADGRIEKKALYSKVDDLETALSHAREEATQVNEALMGMKEARRQQARVKEALEQIQPFGEELSKRAEKMSFDEKRAVIKFFLKDTKIKVHGIQQIGKKRLPFITFDSMFDFDHLQEIAKDSGAGRSLLEALGDPISFFDGSSRSVSRASASGGRKTRLADGRRMAAPTHPGQDRGNLLLYACLHLV